jgi:hypothetical protein
MFVDGHSPLQVKSHRQSQARTQQEAQTLEQHYVTRDKVNTMAAKARLNTTLAHQSVRLPLK